MRIFGGERTAMMDTLKVDENTPIQSKMLTGVIESSQKKIEGQKTSTSERTSQPVSSHISIVLVGYVFDHRLPIHSNALES